MKQYQLIPHNSLSHYQHCSDLWPLKVKRNHILSNYAMSEQRYNFGPVRVSSLQYSCSNHIINNYYVECLYFRDYIFKFVSFSFITVYKNFRFLPRLGANNNIKLAIPTGNTILKRQQCDVCTLCLCYDSGNARNRFQRSARVHIYAFISSMPSISQCYYSIQ